MRVSDYTKWLENAGFSKVNETSADVTLADGLVSVYLCYHLGEWDLRVGSATSKIDMVSVFIWYMFLIGEASDPGWTTVDEQVAFLRENLEAIRAALRTTTYDLVYQRLIHYGSLYRGKPRGRRW